MKDSLPAYRKIDLASWPRREHFQYYRTAVRCGYSVTVPVDVSEAVSVAKRRGLHFYPCFVYAAAKTVNQQDAMRMMLTPEGEPGVWEVSHPCFTVFHPDDGTFSDLWTAYEPEFSAFYRGFEQTKAEFGDRHGIKGRPGQPANFFCISCVPWLDYTGYATYSSGEPALFPILTFGKYTLREGRYTLPVTLTISHASADGWHTSRFFQALRENLRAFADMDGAAPPV